MSHVVGKLELSCGCRDISATFSEMTVVSGPRPKKADEIAGCDPEILKALNLRNLETKMYDLYTTARLGAGCALIVDDIRKLAQPQGRLRDNFRKKVPSLFDSEGDLVSCQGLICLWRDGYAGGTFWCADVCAGVPEMTDILAGAFNEAVETGLHSIADSIIEPARLMMADNPYQHVMDTATHREWGHLRGVKVRFPHTIPVQCLAVGADSINGVSCILSAEPYNGSVEVIVPLLLNLPEVEDGWRWFDTEHMKLGDNWAPLKRRSILIVPIPNAPPVLLGFGPDGVDPHGTIAYLEGSNLEMLINAKVRMTLNALGWLPK